MIIQGGLLTPPIPNPETKQQRKSQVYPTGKTAGPLTMPGKNQASEQRKSGNEKHARPYGEKSGLDEKGLRATLASKQLIGGPLVNLDIHEDADPASLDQSHQPPLIPAGQSTAEQVKEHLQAFIDKVTNLPLEPLVDDAKESLLALKALVEGPEPKEALANLRDSTSEIEAFVEWLDGRLDSVVASINGMLNQASETLVSVQRSLGDRSPILTDLRKLLRELDGAARSLRLMADYLERHPDALLRGKKDTRQ